VLGVRSVLCSSRYFIKERQIWAEDSRCNAHRGGDVKDLRTIKSSLLAVLVFLISHVDATAATYYIAPNGSDVSAGTSSAPWATFSKAMTVLSPGDTLFLKNGTYYQSLDITVSGTEVNPITIKAQNDGKAIIDGQGNIMPCRINGATGSHLHDIVVEGIVCRNSNEDVIYIRDADRITFSRVSAYNTGDGNFMGFSLWRTTYVTLIDCAASGFSRKPYNLLDTEYTTMRRCWGRWVSGPTYGGYTGISVYNSNYALIENCVLTKDPSAVSGVKAVAIAGQYGKTANYNELYGNVFYNHNLQTVLISSDQRRTEGNKLVNNVGIDNAYGILQRADADLRVQRLTLASSQASNYMAFSINEDLSYTKNTNFEIRGDVTNSVFLNFTQGFNVSNNGRHLIGFTNDYNNLYNITNPYVNDVKEGPNNLRIIPAFDTATYGKGAYLMVPSALKGKGENGEDIGAEVLYLKTAH